MKHKFEESNLNTQEKLVAIGDYIKLNILEKKKYFSHSKYEIKSLDENLKNFSRSESFHQDNFKNLIEKCKTFIKVRIA